MLKTENGFPILALQHSPIFQCVHYTTILCAVSDIKQKECRKLRRKTFGENFVFYRTHVRPQTTINNMNVVWFGRSVESSDISRPLLFSFKNLEDKECVVSNLRNLRQAETIFKGVNVSHDLTPT